MRNYLFSNDSLFISCGREDVNVLMLNKGRPCALEFKSSKIMFLSINDLIKLERKINKHLKFKIKDLRIINLEYFLTMKFGAEFKNKSYRAIIYCKKALDKEELSFFKSKIINLIQWTPIRVLQRRSRLARIKSIIKIRFEFIRPPNWIIIYLKTKAGTYIKEFFNSDRGRSIPNLKSLLGSIIRVIQLDVIKVDIIN